MLLWRLTLGPCILAALVGLCWLDFYAARPGVYLWLLAMGVSLLAVRELLALLGSGDRRQMPNWVVYAGTLITVFAAGMPILCQHNIVLGPIGQLGWLALGLMVSLLLVVVSAIGCYEGERQIVPQMASAFFAIAYAGGLIGFLVQLRLVGSNAQGMVALGSLIAIVKMSDIGQYTVGRLIGKHKLAPRLSPGKTWEGFFGGLVFAVGAACLLQACPFWKAGGMQHSMGLENIISWCGYAVALAVAGVAGDLAESMLKREAGVKDSSTWLPGFGGVLDLLDSLLLAAPVAYLFWAFCGV